MVERVDEAPKAAERKRPRGRSAPARAPAASAASGVLDVNQLAEVISKTITATSTATSQALQSFEAQSAYIENLYRRRAGAELQPFVGVDPLTGNRSAGPAPLPEDERILRAEAFDLIGSEEEVDLWFSSPNANIGGRTPSAEIRDGRSDNVQHILDSLRYIGIS